MVSLEGEVQHILSSLHWLYEHQTSTGATERPWVARRTCKEAQWLAWRARYNTSYHHCTGYMNTKLLQEQLRPGAAHRGPL